MTTEAEVRVWNCDRDGHLRAEAYDGTGVNARLIGAWCQVCGKAIP